MPRATDGTFFPPPRKEPTVPTRTKRHRKKATKLSPPKPKRTPKPPPPKAPPGVLTIPSQCPACHSSNRQHYKRIAWERWYRATQTLDLPGNGTMRYNHVIGRRATCADCGQVRYDKEHRLDTPTPDAARILAHRDEWFITGGSEK